MIKNILFDFDGVILDSMKIKGDGFVELFQDYEKNDIGKIGNEEMILTVDLEMLEEFELVDNLDLIENLDDLMNGIEKDG